MWRILASPVEGSEDPRILHSEAEPEESGGLLKFITHPVPRVVRLPLADILEVVNLDAPKPKKKRAAKRAADEEE